MCNSQCLMHLCVCLCVGVCAAQSSPTLCCTWTCSPPGSSVYGTSQAKKKKKNWSGLPCPLPGDLPDPGIKYTSPAPPALVGRFFTTELPGNPFDAHNKI